ncbi:hypothetical protein G3M73_09950 [Escherichia coli]|uniref:LuxR C-terminal-related transcriptional regulator n=1 Tax=Escherichia coli TaxID=562 RepID=UPI0013A08A06|nr:LuxR C-terminal-related transcriptional regulator [Escherichia coli]QIB19487.1 hypothetical protein G3M73_09950 [Escherichia coli]QIF15448.1 hypothetical protein G6Z99_22185 [Escherichia coli]
MDIHFKAQSPEAVTLAVWPDNNPLFTDSLAHLITEINVINRVEDFLFVNFCIDNFIYFIHDEWLEKLNKSGLRGVLVIDRFMHSLANYWREKQQDIILLSVGDRDLTSFVSALNSLSYGQSRVLEDVMPITEKEIFVLRKRLSGMSVRNIALTLNCSVKSIYYCQYSLLKKLRRSSRIGEIYIHHSHVHET